MFQYQKHIEPFRLHKTILNMLDKIKAYTVVFSDQISIATHKKAAKSTITCRRGRHRDKHKYYLGA